MLQRYKLNSILDYKNAIKEIIQEIVLLGLWRAKFFEEAAFYGGTALRILYQLDRFSEGLDFSLLHPNPHFNIVQYEKAIQNELKSLGFTAKIEKKNNSTQSSVDSAFIKVNTVHHLLLIGMPDGLNKGLHPEEIIKVRFEVDTDPPAYEAVTENVILLLPYPFSVKTFHLEDLFAGKVHATLCREWKGRVKGRDWYDLVWFISRNIRLNIRHLELRMRQTGHWAFEKRLTPQELIKLFDEKINSLDIASAKEDIINFIKDPSQIDMWSKSFFQTIVQKITFSNT